MIKNNYITFSNQKNLIKGVVIRKLIIHKDDTGSLVETLRTDWPDVIDRKSPFTMQYLSITPASIARDEDQWHFHKFQKDRFICVVGRIVTAIYDPREKSPTFAKLNLMLMGPENEDEMYMMVIPQQTYHGFMVVSKHPGYLLNFPTKLYNSKDEGRAKNVHLRWQEVRNDFFK